MDLHSSFSKGDLEAVDKLIKMGVDVNKANGCGSTPLLIAATLRCRRREFVEKFLQAGANPQLTNAFGGFPLLRAAEDNYLDSVCLLLRAGADPNQTNEHEESPIGVAA